MSTLLVIALFIEIHLVLNYPISTWWIPVFMFTLELIIKAITSFPVFAMQKNDVNEGKNSIVSVIIITKYNSDYIFWTKMGSKCCELIGGCIMLLNAM